MRQFHEWIDSVVDQGYGPEDCHDDFEPDGDCPRCEGSGSVVCDAFGCEGSGCSLCLDGERTCPDCGGSGFTEPPPPFDPELDA